MSPYTRSRLNLAPCPVGVKRLDRAGHLRGVDAEILLIHDAVVAHDEGHDSRDAVLGRERNERESPNHVAPDDEIVGAAGRIGTLREQQAIEIAVIGGRSAPASSRVPVSSGLGYQWTQRALRLGGLCFPVEAVVFSLGAAKPLSVLQNTGAGVVLGVVLALGVDVGQTYLDRAELVSADATIENLLAPSRGVPAPAGAVWDERDSEREIVAADVEG